MSVATEINRLNKAKSDLKTSINNKLDDNQTKITNETLDNYSAFVDSIKQGADLVIINYEDTDAINKEKVKSILTKEDGTLSRKDITKPCILIAPLKEPAPETTTVTGQWICYGGEATVSEQDENTARSYSLFFTSATKLCGLRYDVTSDTLTYQWIDDALEATSNKTTKIGTPETISDKKYPSEKAVYDYVNEKAVQSDYNQNDSTASDYIKNRPFYDLVTPPEILLDLTNPTLETWNVYKTFENNNDVLDFMNNLKVSDITLTVDNSSENCVERSEIIPQDLSYFNFPSDSYDVTNSTPYALSFNSLDILFVNCIDNESNYVILYYIASFAESTVPSIQKLLLTSYRSELKQIQDKFIYSIVDTSDKDPGDFDPYGEAFQQDFMARNGITDLSTKPAIDPKPSMVFTPSGLCLVTHTWDDGELL